MEHDVRDSPDSSGEEKLVPNGNFKLCMKMTLIFQESARLEQWILRRHILALHWRNEERKDYKDICNPNCGECMPETQTLRASRDDQVPKTVMQTSIVLVGGGGVLAERVQQAFRLRWKP